MEIISASQAARVLGISIDKLRVLEKQGLIHASYNKEGVGVYSSKEIVGIKSRRGLTLSEEAAKVGAQIEYEIASSVIFIRKVLIFAGCALSGYVLLVAIFTVLFIFNPLQTAQWLGIVKAKINTNSIAQKNQEKQVLGVEISAIQEGNSSIQTVLQPVGKVSLGLVKNISPNSYSQVAKVAIIDTNDVLGLDASGAIIPVRPINLSESSLLKVGSNALITNLNSQYIQGRQPGTNPGDIAIVEGAISPAPTSITSGLTDTNPVNDSLTINSGTGISGGGIVSRGNSITLTNSGVTSLTGTTNQINVSGSAGGVTLSLPQSIDTSSVPSFASLSLKGISNQLVLGEVNTGTLSWSPSVVRTLAFPDATDILVGKATVDTLTNKTISAGTNTISGLTNSNLSGSAGINNVNLANSSFTTNGNSGSGSVALGGSLTFSGSGIVDVAASGSTVTLTSTEVDTLQSVFDRGNTITSTTGNGIIVDSSDATVTGTANGLMINAPTTIPSAGTYNSLNLGTSTSPTTNAYDQATIAVGNIASTAQQNFSTLNITNGGTGFLDVELIRGFINFQGMNTLYDDFTSRSLNTADRWTSTSVGTGSTCSILAGGLSGLFRMHSGAGANRGCELTTRPISSLTGGYYQRSSNPIFETKVRIDIVTNARIFAGFADTRVVAASEISPNTNHAYIAKKAADTTWQCVTDDGGATETTTNTGVTIKANTFYRLRVELRSGAIPETICTIDDGTTVTRTVVTATQPASTSPMDVYVKLNQSNTVAKNMDVDYVRAWQDDPPNAMILTADGNLQSESVAFDANSAAEEEVSFSTTSTFKEAVASVSGDLVMLVDSSIESFLKNLVEFFGNVIFHADVTFLGRPAFNKDTAGHAVVKAGSNEVGIIFEKEYVQNPVVTASVNLVDGAVMGEIPAYAIYDVTTKGFKIRLSKVIAFDLSFSWIALAVNGDKMSTSGASSTSVLSPTPISLSVTSETASPTVIPSILALPSQEIVPSATVIESASLSASIL